MTFIPGQAPDPAAPVARSTGYQRLGRFLLFAVGVAALGAMIHQVGAATIGTAISRTARWLPLICALDFMWVALEGGALLTLYGAERRSIPGLAWLHVSLVHYATFMLVPMGRASAELTRAALIKRYVNRDLAAAGAALMQSLTMVSNGITSLIAASFLVTLAHSRTLLFAVVGNASMLLVLGVLSYLVLRHVKVGGFLGKKFKKLAEAGPGFDQQFVATKPRHAVALVFCVLGRCLQAVQYGIIILAVTGQLSIPHAWIAEGIQMAARSAGDFIPNQVGVTEGAFVFFREALDLNGTPAAAMSIALVARISNMAVAVVCILLAQLRLGFSRS